MFNDHNQLNVQGYDSSQISLRICRTALKNIRATIQDMCCVPHIWRDISRMCQELEGSLQTEEKNEQQRKKNKSSWSSNRNEQCINTNDIFLLFMIMNKQIYVHLNSLLKQNFDYLDIKFVHYKQHITWRSISRSHT